VKAINNLESPPKEKHVRNLILGTFYERSVLPFWYNALKLQLYGNAIVCWKFCYALHRMMRDGFASTVDESFRYVVTLEDLAKSWIHLKHDYGNMLFHYCNFLSFKLKFHKKNKLIPASLQIEMANLNELASNDISNYFQFCCDFFDYLDEILVLQNVIFVSMDRNRNNSMTEAGQCKLTPLVLCVQESNQLYDFCVNFMFKLHETLPGDTLEGHRERFYKMFRQLNKFYECCRNLQYFKTLITIPELPPNPPNFHQLSDFDLYKKPTMMVVEPAPSECDSSIQEEDSILLDFSDTQTERSETPTNQESLLQQQQNQFIQQLIQEIERLRAELERLTLESETEIRKLRTRIKELEDELIAQRSEVEQERIRNANLEEKIKIASESEKAKADLDNLEKKAVSSEEKFNKMKELYTKLKNEHVNLLRQEADVRKQKASLAETCEHAKKMQRELEKRLEDEVAEKSKLETSLQSKVSELQAIKSETEKSQSDYLAINRKHDMELRLMEEEKCDLVNELNDLTQSLQLANETQRKLEHDAQKAKEKVNELEAEMSKHKAEMAALNAKLSDSLKEKQNADADFALLQNQLCSSVYLKTLDNCEQLIRDALQLFDDPVLLNCKSGAEFLLNNLNSFGDKFTQFTQYYTKHLKSAEDADTFASLIRNANTFSKLIADTVVSGKITSLTAADFNQGEQLADLCRHAGQDSLGLLSKMRQKETDVSEEERKLNDLIKKVMHTLTDLLPKVHDINKEEIGDLIDQEMQKTSEAIESAVAKLEVSSLYIFYAFFI
jgi:huntingtin interacting protein 1